MDNDLARAISSTDAKGLACQTDDDDDVDGSSSSDSDGIMLMRMKDPLPMQLLPPRMER